VLSDGNQGLVKGLGKIAILPDHSISNIFLVDSLDYNLLSVSQLCKMGYNCLFTDIGVGAKAKTPPFARGLRRGRWSDRDKAGRDTLRSIRHFGEGLQRRLPAARPRSVLRPTCDLAHCNRPYVAAFVLRA
jgi:hypothetical protein